MERIGQTGRVKEISLCNTNYHHCEPVTTSWYITLKVDLLFVEVILQLLFIFWNMVWSYTSTDLAWDFVLKLIVTFWAFFHPFLYSSLTTSPLHHPHLNHRNTCQTPNCSYLIPIPWFFCRNSSWHHPCHRSHLMFEKGMNEWIGQSVKPIDQCHWLNLYLKILVLIVLLQH